MAAAAVLTGIGASTEIALVGSVASVTVVYIFWALYTSHHRPVVRAVIEQDVRRMDAARMTPSEIAGRAGIETHQVRQILAGDDHWWVKP
jgi:hypothetical protein